MRVTIRPSLAPDRELDVTSALTAAVARELWRHCGGNDVLNWLEAERFVEGLAGDRAPEMRRHPLKRGRKAGPKPRKPRRPTAGLVKSPRARI